MSDTPPRGLALHNKILIGLILGAVCGMLAAQYVPKDRLVWINKYVMTPVGEVFLNMLLMTVIPLVFASLAVGIAQLGDLGKLGRMGARAFGYFTLSMVLACAIGLTLVNTLRPGDYVSEEGREKLKQEYQSELKKKEKRAEEKPFGVETFVNIVTKNPIASAVQDPPDMLGIIFFAIVFGAALTRINPERAKPLVQALEGVTEVMVWIIGLAMKLAPYGVFAFLFRVSSTLGLDVVRLLGMYVFVVVLGLAIHFFVSFPVLLIVFSRLNPIEFFRRVRPVIVTAFSTSSSNATLPTSLKVTQEALHVPPQVAGFVLPLGATMNMNGTALYEGVTVVFLAQAFGVPLDFGQQMIVIAMSVLMAVGAAGVPGGSLPLIMIILQTVGVDPQNLAIILGVDRILDMCRTTLNVVGDVTAATYIARAEGFPLMDEGVEVLRPKEPDEMSAPE